MPNRRTAFYRCADNVIGPCWTTGRGDVYRVASDWTVFDALHAFSRDYPAERDALDGFLLGVYVPEPGSRVVVTALFADFQAFAAEHRIIELQRWSSQAFYRALEERGHARRHSTGGKFVVVVVGVNKAPHADFATVDEHTTPEPERAEEATPPLAKMPVMTAAYPTL